MLRTQVWRALIVRSIRAPDARFKGIHARNRTRCRHGGVGQGCPRNPGPGHACPGPSAG